jgi:hypothetical protein
MTYYAMLMTMEATDLAFRAKRKGDLEQAESLFRQAFELEANAAMLVPQDASHASKS